MKQRGEGAKQEKSYNKNGLGSRIAKALWAFMSAPQVI